MYVKEKLSCGNVSKSATMVIILAIMLEMTYNVYADHSCRNVIYKLPIENMSLKGHVINRTTVYSKEQCEVECYLNPDCVSLNFKTTPGVNCEVSSSDEINHPKNFTKTVGTIYQAMENNCNKKSCPNANMTCQSGFGNNGYRCVCPKCSRGDSFPKLGTQPEVIKINPFNDSLTAFTISVWAQVDPKAKYPTFMTYTLKDANNKINEMGLMIENLKNTVGEKIINMFSLENLSVKYSAAEILDGGWHHIAITWNGDNATIFIDREYMTTGNFKRPSIGISGALVLGQEQDRYLGGYDEDQSYQGNMTSFNMWNRVLKNDEIKDLASKCPSGEGNILKWTDLISGRNEKVGFFCGHICTPL